MNISKKKAIIIVVLIFVILVMLYLQMGRDVEVVNNHISSSENGYEENITIIANKIGIVDQEELAAELVKRCIDNNFHEIRFSYDLRGYPNGLHITVYSNDIMYKLGITAFEAVYQQNEGDIYKYN